MSKDHVRIGILGCGLISGAHIRAVDKIDDASIVAVCDMDRSRAESTASKLAESGPLVKVFDDYRQMLDSANLDAMIVCLPPFGHGSEVHDAAAAGVNLLVEKPIALTSEHAFSMAEAAEKAGIVTHVGYMMRYSPAINKIADLISDGTAGKPTLFQATYACNALHAPWWREREKSGGQIFEQAIHLYDLSMFYLGTPKTVAGVMANLCHTDVERYTVEDTSTAAIQFESGAVASMTATNCAIPGQWNHTFTLFCERLQATLVNGKKLTLVYTGGDKVRTEEHTYEDDVFLAEDTVFVQAVRDGGGATVPLRVGAEGVQLVEAVTRAAEQKSVVTL